MSRRLLAALVGGSVLATACFDLDTRTIQPTGGTTYTRDQLIAKPALMERLVAGTFVTLWRGVREAEPWVHFGVFGEEVTTSVNSIGGDMWEVVGEPRGEVPNFLGVQHQVMRNPWHTFYEANSSAAEYGGLVKRDNIRIIDPATRADNTARFLAFARFVQGISHVYLGLIFDSAAVVGEDVDLSVPQVLPLVGHYEVLDSAVKWLEDAIAIANTNNFAFPLNEGQWIYRTGFDNKQLAAVAHSYIARALVYGARTAAERSGTATCAANEATICRNVDWGLVKSHLLLGTRANFGPRGRPSPSSNNDGQDYGYRTAISSHPDGNNCSNECDWPGLMRVDTRIVGPADTTGVYQEWLGKVAGARFDTVESISISTYDARIQAVGGTLPSVLPVYFKYTDVVPPESEWLSGLRGPYYHSHYWSSSRARNSHTQFANTFGGANEPDDFDLVQDEMMLAAEMDLLLAEANIRLGGAANLTAAADLINRTRVNGDLPAVTAAGVPPSVPGFPCIPKVWDGSALGACGTLMEALQYEKRLETWGTGIAFFDARGWGCLAQGTPMQLAPPANQLDLLGKLVYSFGGNDGVTKGADRPTNCRLLHKP